MASFSAAWLVRYDCNMSVLTASAMLFDLDGVLIDSTPAVARVWTQWAIKHGFDPEKTVREAHGRPSIESIRELLPDADHEAENREVERQEIEDTGGVVPLPGALALLTSLPQNRWAIVTSCTRPLAEVRIRTAGLPVPPTMITSSDINTMASLIQSRISPGHERSGSLLTLAWLSKMYLQGFVLARLLALR